MKKSNQAKLAYAAGVIDSDAAISIYQKSFRNGEFSRTELTNYHLTVVVSQKDGRIIDWLFGNFGGSVYLLKKHIGKNSETGAVHQWTVSYRYAQEFLKSILPFLVKKKHQAEIAIRFQTRVSGQMGKRMNEHELLLRKNLYDEIRKEKRDYHYSKHPNVQAKKSSVQL